MTIFHLLKFYGKKINCFILILNLFTLPLFNQEDIYYLIVQNDIDGIDKLLKSGLNPDTITKYEETLLIVAARYDRVEILQKLLNAGANVGKRIKTGRTALWCAAYEGHYQCVEKLLESGANINLALEDGRTPLFAASGGGKTDIVKLLLSKGANVNTVDGRGETPLIIVHDSPDKDDNVKALLQAGAAIEHRSKDGKTALINSVLQCRTSKVRALIEAGADTTAPFTKGEPLLDLAKARISCKEIVRILTEKRAK